MLKRNSVRKLTNDKFSGRKSCFTAAVKTCNFTDMATASSLLSKDRFLCSVCLDVFSEPVTTSCGHTFCSACIHKYWDSSDICQCPLCKRKFSPKPELQINTFVSELAAEFKTSVQDKASTPEPQLPETSDVLCDICPDIKEKAVKSCLTCLASFCEVHLEPHQRVAVFKSHILLDPVKNLDERICKIHNKTTELFCRTDQACICALCFKTDHKGHTVVSLEEEYEAVVAKKDVTIANIQKMIQLRSEKIAEIENVVDVSQRQAEKEKEASVQVFTDLICSIQSSQAELVKTIEERLRATKQKAEGFLTELKMEVTELESRSSKLEQLSQSEDHQHFLQSFISLSSPLNKDWTSVSVHSDLSFEATRGAVTELKQRLDQIMRQVPENERMKRMREHAVDLTLDLDTAYYSLVISQDGKQVNIGDKRQFFPPNPKRFETYSEVLSKESFTTGKFYYEVQVTGKTHWAVGVARESVERKQKAPLSVQNGYWTIGLRDGEYNAYPKPNVKITVKEKLQKVGIFVDYEKGEVSFYDADSKSHLYSFTGHFFREKLYPYFYPGVNKNGTNSAPLIITSVPQTH